MVPRSHVKRWFRLVHIIVVLVAAWSYGKIDGALRRGTAGASGNPATTMSYAEFERQAPRTGRFRLIGCSTYALAASCGAQAPGQAGVDTASPEPPATRNVFVPLFDRDQESPTAKSAVCLITRDPRLNGLIDEMRVDGFFESGDPSAGGHAYDAVRLARLRAWMASNLNRLIYTRTVVGAVKSIRELKPDLLRGIAPVRGHLKPDAVIFVEDSSAANVPASLATLERERYILGTFLALLLAGECLMRARPGRMRSSPLLRPAPPKVEAAPP